MARNLRRKQEIVLNLDPVALAPKATIHSIQLLRAIAAGLVALFHAHQAFAAQVTQTWFANEEYVFGFGAVGVHIFFVISGFIMVVTSFGHEGFRVRAFFRRRLVRIYPIYWICALLYLAVHEMTSQPYDLTGQAFLGALVLWPGSASGIIGPAWTLGFEMFFYVCFGLAMTLGLTRGLVILGAVFASSILAGAALESASAFVQVITNTLLLEFLAGSAIGWLTLQGRLPVRFGASLTGFATMLFAAGLVIDYNRWPSALTWGVPSAILVLGLVAWESRTGAASAVRWGGQLGDSSYVLYLIHTLLVALAVDAAWAHGGQTSLAPITAGFVIATAAVAIAHGAHLLVERPLMRRLNPSRTLLPPRPALAREVG